MGADSQGGVSGDSEGGVGDGSDTRERGSEVGVRGKVGNGEGDGVGEC